MNVKESGLRLDRDVPVGWRNVSSLARGNRARTAETHGEGACPEFRTNLQLRIAARNAWRLKRDVWLTSNYLYTEAFDCLF
jgi:hypothetical protein